jgi:hypothetical protein
MTAPLENASPNSEPLYKTWDSPDSFNEAMRSEAKAMNEIQPVERSTAGSLHRFRGIDTGTSVRDGFSRFDYEYFRYEETIPKRHRDIIAFCMAAYSRIGLIRNIIDLMGDFGSQGVRIVHPDQDTETFYNAWFKRVNGKERSERFLNLLYRTGNVIVKRTTARYKRSDINLLQKGIASPDIKKVTYIEDPEPGEIPWKYYFLNPLTLELMGKELALFTDQIYFGIKINNALKSAIKNPKNKYEKEMIKNLPLDIKQAAQTEKQLLMLDPNKISAYYYKKDDWMPWAFPMLYSVLDDLILYEKLKLADLTALDGAIQHIRIWKLGSLEHKIVPTNAAIAKLSALLMNAAGNGSVMDLIWGPELELEETSTDIHNFLGSKKYEPVLASIYAGLGIPQMFTGTKGKSGMTSDFIQIKTFVERLEYGRYQLNQFWNQETELIRKAMKNVPGFNSKIPAEVIYDHMSLTDEAAMTKLLMDLVDRDIISKQTVQEELGRVPKVERERLMTEIKDRDNIPKVSPYHDAQPDLTLEKIFAQKGVITPSEVGLKLDERKDGEKTAMDLQMKQKQIGKSKPKGTPGQGRPKNATDTKPRKKRIPLVASETNAFLWAQSALSKISDILLPAFLAKFEKSNLRKFTEAEHKLFEDIKFGVLTNTEPFQAIDSDAVIAAINEPFDIVEVKSKYNEYLEEYYNLKGEHPGIEDQRLLRCLAYVGVFYAG